MRLRACNLLKKLSKLFGIGRIDPTFDNEHFETLAKKGVINM